MLKTQAIKVNGTVHQVSFTQRTYYGQTVFVWAHLHSGPAHWPTTIGDPWQFPANGSRHIPRAELRLAIESHIAWYTMQDEGVAGTQRSPFGIGA